MASDIAIRVENLGKRYRLGELDHHRSLKAQLRRAATAPWRLFSSVADNEYVWALKDVSFDVNRGEVLGLIGSNGAGKSTLLKILTQITRPTEGRAEIHGRVGSLLEVGTGFHPELTGRENIYLNGAILGMRRWEIQHYFDEIVDFSGVERFLDTPVKRYSSGMRVRLAFAVAAFLQPEILLIDEVLAVGDAQFQKKCLGRMSEVAKEGRTILFVSHNMTAISTLCQRIMLLEDGHAVMDGDAAECIRTYLGAKTDGSCDRVWDNPQTAPGNEWIRLHRVRLNPGDGRNPKELTLDCPFSIEFEYWNMKPETRLNLSVGLFNAENICVFRTTTVEEPHWHGRPFPSGLFRSVCHIPADLLNDGEHRIDVMFVKDSHQPVYRDESILTFTLHECDRQGTWFGKQLGAVRPRLDWTTERINDPRTGEEG